MLQKNEHTKKNPIKDKEKAPVLLKYKHITTSITQN